MCKVNQMTLRQVTLMAIALCVGASCNRDPAAPSIDRTYESLAVVDQYPWPDTWADIWVSDSGEAFAVSSNGGIAHNDGNRWERSTVDAVLDCVWGVSETEVYAGGKDGALLRYDGTSWSRIETDTDASIRGIWGDGREVVYVAGTKGFLGRITSSGIEAIPVTTSAIHSIWGHAANDFYLATSDGLLRVQDRLVKKVNSVSYVELSGFGEFILANTNNVIHLIQDGVVTKLGDELFYVYDVWGTGPDDIYAVGSEVVRVESDGDVVYQYIEYRVTHYDGTTWRALASPMQWPTAVSGNSFGRVFVVGRSGSIFQFDAGVETSRRDQRYRSRYSDVSISPGGDIAVVGNYRSVLLRNGHEWSSSSGPDAGSENYLNAVWGLPGGDVLVANARGVSRHQGLNEVETAFLGPIAAIWGRSASDVFAVGGNYVHRFDGTRWSPVELEPPPEWRAFRDVWGDPWGHTFAVTAGGVVVHIHEDGWGIAHRRPAGGLSTIAGSGSGNVYAGGYDGGLVHFDGNNWTEFPSPTSLPIDDIAVSPAGVFIVADGNVYHHDGMDWSELETPRFIESLDARGDLLVIAGREVSVLRFQ